MQMKNRNSMSPVPQRRTRWRPTDCRSERRGVAVRERCRASRISDPYVVESRPQPVPMPRWTGQDRPGQLNSFCRSQDNTVYKKAWAARLKTDPMCQAATRASESRIRERPENERPERRVGSTPSMSVCPAISECTGSFLALVMRAVGRRAWLSSNDLSLVK